MSTVNTDSGKYALGFHLHLAFIALTETLNKELHKAGLELTHPQFTILQAVFRKPGMSQRELAMVTAKDGAAITRSLAYLEKLGLLERKRINGRAKGVFATARAENLRPALDKAIKNTLDRACVGLDDEKIESMNSVLQRIKAALSCDK